MRHFRSFRGSRRGGSPRPLVRTYKKVLNFAEASFTAGQRSETLIEAKDSVALGQTNATDATVPTGARCRYFLVQMPITNSSSQTAYINCCIEYTLGGQSGIDPDAVGGNSARNQVMHQSLFSVGFNQNSTHNFKIKVPKQFQRLREGMIWRLIWSNSNTINRRLQVIYKIEL